jgi:flagellin-specific chaperone FliS
MSYKLTSEAGNDLIEIYLYGFQNFGEAQAENYFSELEEVFRMLGETPAGNAWNFLRLSGFILMAVTSLSMSLIPTGF